jgi:monofunctional chorismate mutase
VTSKLSLDELRAKIDEVDQQLLRLLHQRVALVMAVGEYKRERDIPVYDPARERALLERLSKGAEPPLDAHTVRSIFERIVDESRRIEQHHVG